jgi:hypothetical protein
MPAVETNHADAPRRKPRPPGLSAGESLLADKLDDVVEEVRALREKAPSPRLLIGAILFFFSMQSATTVYVISALISTRGVDMGAAADATRTVVTAGASAPATVTTTTETVTSPAEVPGG